MRNLLIICLFSFFIVPLLHAQVPYIQCLNGSEICCGFQPNNIAQVKVVAPPSLPLPSGSAFTYVWISEHQNGTTWTWHTSVNQRAIPIPWEGEYTVRVQVIYIQIINYTPFASFWSNSIKIHGKQCSILEKSSNKKR